MIAAGVFDSCLLPTDAASPIGLGEGYLLPVVPSRALFVGTRHLRDDWKLRLIGRAKGWREMRLEEWLRHRFVESEATKSDRERLCQCGVSLQEACGMCAALRPEVDFAVTNREVAAALTACGARNIFTVEDFAASIQYKRLTGTASQDTDNLDREQFRALLRPILRWCLSVTIVDRYIGPASVGGGNWGRFKETLSLILEEWSLSAVARPGDRGRFRIKTAAPVDRETHRPITDPKLIATSIETIWRELGGRQECSVEICSLPREYRERFHDRYLIAMCRNNVQLALKFSKGLDVVSREGGCGWGTISLCSVRNDNEGYRWLEQALSREVKASYPFA